jgi:hypothetical protein
MVQIVGNLEWELLKNVEIRKSKYARITHSIRGPPFREFRLYQEKSHMKTVPYTRKYHFFHTAQNPH